MNEEIINNKCKCSHDCIYNTIEGCIKADLQFKEYLKTYEILKKRTNDLICKNIYNGDKMTICDEIFNIDLLTRLFINFTNTKIDKCFELDCKNIETITCMVLLSNNENFIVPICKNHDKDLYLKKDSIIMKFKGIF